MGISIQEKILIEQRVTNEAKSTGATYLLWFFLGGLGVHRFYLGRAGSGAAMLSLTILGFLLFMVFIGGLLLLAVAVWWLVDVFLIPGMIAAQKNEVRQRLTVEALAQNGQKDEVPVLS